MRTVTLPEITDFVPPDMVRVDFEWARLETDKAICLVFADIGEVWLPKSQINYGINPSGLRVVDLPEWLARKHKLI